MSRRNNENFIKVALYIEELQEFKFSFVKVFYNICAITKQHKVGTNVGYLLDI